MGADDLYGYSGDGNKKFSFFLNDSDPDEKMIYDKLMRINKNRRNFLIIDILRQYFSSDTEKDKLVNAVENFSIFARNIKLWKDAPAVAPQPQVVHTIERIIERQQTITGGQPVARREISAEVPEGDGPGFIAADVDILAEVQKLAAAAANDPTIVDVVESQDKYDDIVAGIFAQGMSVGEK